MFNEVIDPKVVLAEGNERARIMRMRRVLDDRVVGDIKWAREYKRPIHIMMDDGKIYQSVYVMLAVIPQDVVVIDDGLMASLRHIKLSDIAATEISGHF